MLYDANDTYTRPALRDYNLPITAERARPAALTQFRFLQIPFPFIRRIHMQHFKTFRKRAAALLLSGVMLMASVHLSPPASADNAWVMDSVNKLTQWGVITGRDTGDQALNSVISRAEITAMVNRAYGYTETGAIPFTDVPSSAWYSDDISIGYNAGYFNGTTETTADPTGSLTREQAISLMARNLRLPESSGEVTQFTDGRSFSTWSMGHIKAAVENGLINGYSDGTFRPKNEITRAEMIKLLADSLGTLVNAEGTHSLGDVMGNVTINSPNITLKDTTIAGDLYLTGGVGQGGVVLDNVNVLGRIIVAGGGESEAGGESIVLRNVAAQSMLVDSMSDQYVSIGVQNDTVIPETTLKSNAYILDNTRSGIGLQHIVMDGDPEAEEPMNVTVSGNIEEVVNLTPGSHLTVSDGTANVVTIDEKAVDSTMTITEDAVVETLNLDAGIAVDGDGDIGTLNVNAPGASTSMLPDNIVIRPGITANIAGTVMDTKLGKESSDDPRLLAGYPRADDLAPNSVLGVFSGNKAGTVYYAVTAEQYGPVEDAEILVKPPTYGPTYTARGNLRLTASNTEASVRISGLTPDGTYYLSAVLVDARDDRSPVKWVKFTTPDNTVPNFTTGYPTISKVIDIDAQLSAMTNKDCEMYYAIYPRGSAAPTANHFLSNSLEGALATGVYDMKKNTPLVDWLTGTPIDGGAGSINGILEEETDYDLYLWLNDRDGGLSSAVRKLQFTTVDVTPPEFIVLPYVTNEAARAVTLTGSLNEDGTIYWVAVPEGEMYPKPSNNPAIDTGAHAVTVNGGTGGGTYKAGDLVTVVPETTTSDVFYRWSVEPSTVTLQMVTPDEGTTITPGTATFRMPDEAVIVTAYFISREDYDSGTENPRLIRGTTITSGSGVALDSEYAKMQVRNGMNAFKRGSTSARELTDFNFTVSGLDPQTRYDVYYVAVDKAGNYSDTVRKITINTLDNIAPKVSQEFTRFADGDTVNTTHPFANTDIRLIFDEEVMTTHSTRTFLELYQDVVAARNNPTELAIARETLGSALSSSIQLYTSGRGTSLPEPVGEDIIDFRKAVIELEDDGKMVITFRSTDNEDTNALHLHSGTTYFFRIKDITDTSTARNRMGQTDLPRFTTLAAQVFIQEENITRLNGQYYTNSSGVSTLKEADIAFSLTPMSTSTTDDSIDWDMLLWLNTSADLEMYTASSPNGPWRQVRNMRSANGEYSFTTAGTFIGQSTDPLRTSADEDYPQLNATLLENRKYYYALHFTRLGTLTDRRSWSANVAARVNVMAGSSVELSNLAANVTGGYKDMVDAGRVDDISTPANFQTHRQFSDHSAPTFTNGYPTFEAGDTSVIMHLMLNRSGRVHYILAPLTENASISDPTLRYSSPVTTIDLDTGRFPNFDLVPTSGASGSTVELSEITFREAINPGTFSGNKDIKTGNTAVGTVDIPVTIEDLKPDTNYFVYFVLEGTDSVYSDYVMVYKFKTVPVIRPILDLQRVTNSQVSITTDITANENYKLMLLNSTVLNTVSDGILNAPFANYATNGFTPQAGDERITVLDALVKDSYTPNSNGLYPSLFDDYANDTLKETIRRFIQSTSQGDDIVLTGSTSTRPNASQTVDCTNNMDLGNQYVFFAVAKSPLGSGYSFRANYPVSRRDTVSPYITALLCALNYRYDSNQRPIGFAGATITIQFNEPIYFADNDSGITTPRAIDRGRLLDSRPSNFICAADRRLTQAANNVRVAQEEGEAGRLTNTITLTVDNVGGGGYITIANGITDAANNTSRGPIYINLTSHIDFNNPASSDNRIDVSIPNNWDGRSGTPPAMPSNSNRTR